MTSRRLRFQTLENRHLLAGDVPISAAIHADGLPESESGIDSQELPLMAESNLVRTSDAGSSRGSAHDLGDINGTEQIRGRLGLWDRIDMFQFTVQEDAEVQLALTHLTRNADFFLADDRGRVFSQSTLLGRRSESMIETLDAGDYFVAVVARSFRRISYRLTVSAELSVHEESPESPATIDPTLPGPGQTNTDPAPAPTPSSNKNNTDPSPDPAGSIQPLADVAYFGGSREWNLNAIGAPEAWAAGYTGQGVTVAIIDTGVDLDHPDLIDSLYVNPGEIAGNGIDDDGNGFIDDVHGYDFVSNDANPNDSNGHGTHVAGTIAAANNGYGATGVAPDATILPVRVLGTDGSGSDRGVAEGIRYAAAMGAQIINLSLGGGYSRTIQSAINFAQSLGSLIVAAAGNESASTPGYPARFSANYDNVISVGAYNSNGRIAGFSNDVGNSQSVQVDAPGVGVFSTYAGGGYRSISGTSMASPHVAGLAALTLSSNPNLTSKELRDLLAGGVVGTASGSDSLGNANATTTVAHASAGLTSAPVNAASSDAAANRRMGSSSRVRASLSLIEIGVTAPSESASHGQDDELTAFEYAPTYNLTSTLSQKRQTVSETASENLNTTDTVDEVFANEETVNAETDSIDAAMTLLA